MTSEQVYILVTYDGSEVSKAAFAPAARLAKRMQATIALVRVYHAPAEVWVHPDAGYREKELARLIAEWQQEIEAAAAAYSQEHGVPVQGKARLLGKRWNVSGEVLAAADELDAEMICMATHGEGAIRHFFAGSTAQEVLAESKRPVTLIRAGEDN